MSKSLCEIVYARFEPPELLDSSFLDGFKELVSRWKNNAYSSHHLNKNQIKNLLLQAVSIGNFNALEVMLECLGGEPLTTRHVFGGDSAVLTTVAVMAATKAEKLISGQGAKSSIVYPPFLLNSVLRCLLSFGFKLFDKALQSPDYQAVMTSQIRHWDTAQKDHFAKLFKEKDCLPKVYQWIFRLPFLQVWYVCTDCACSICI